MQPSPSPLTSISLDDPRIQPLRERIHAARGHHWQPACGACFDEAYQYLSTGDILDHPAATAVLADVLPTEPNPDAVAASREVLP